MSNLPYILFRPKSDTKGYVILLYWATSISDSDCKVQKYVETVKQEIAVDGFRLRFVAENVPSPRRQFLYLAEHYILVKTQNDNICHLPLDDQQQLESFLKLLKEPQAKKRRVDIVGEV